MPRVERPFRANPRHPVTGKRIDIRGRTKREVQSALHKVAEVRAELRLHKQLGLPIDDEKHGRTLRAIAGKAVTLAQAIESYACLKRLAPGTQAVARGMLANSGRIERGYRCRTGPLFELAGDRLEALTAPRLARHFRALSERLAWATVDRAWHVLSAAVRHAAEQGWIVHKPWGMWRPPRPTHPKRDPERDACRNADERARLLAECAPFALAERTAIACGLYLGLRRGELAGLEQGDVEILRDPGVVACVRVRVVRQYDGAPLKHGELRTIDAGYDLAARLLELLESRPPAVRRLKTHPLFPDTLGGHFKNRNVINVDHLRSAVARAGLGDPKLWSLHSLRDSFCTIEAQACGGDLVKLKERTGHRSFNSVTRYLRGFEREAPRLPPAPPSTTT
jgi:integrase